VSCGNPLSQEGPRTDLQLTPMDSPFTITDSLVNDITAALTAASGKWTGCEWPTEVGQRRLNLNGMRSSQALLMERATAGSEAADWRTAVVWLRQVEQDAQQAEAAARMAVELAKTGRLGEAIAYASRACDIEQRYRRPLTWQPLLNVIAAALDTSEAGHGTAATS
jgi:hypothetical protein